MKKQLFELCASTLALVMFLCLTGCYPEPAVQQVSISNATLPVSVNATLNVSYNATMPVYIMNATLPVVVPNNTRVIATPYLYQIAEGNLPGHVPWSKTGYNPSVGTTEEDIWYGSTAYVWPAAAQQMELYSSSPNDKPGGSGVQSVYFNYLDSNYIERQEIISLNGTNPILTVNNDIFRIQNFRAYSVGNSTGAAGNIEIRNILDTPVYSYIAAGYTCARNACWTVPAGKTLYITQIAFSENGGKWVRFTTRATYDNAIGAALTPGKFFMPYSEVILLNASYTRELIMPTKLPEKTDIKVSVISDAAGAMVSSMLSGWLEDN